MASIVVSGDTSGAITIAAPAVAGTNTLTLPASTGTLVVTGGAQTIEFADGSAAAPSITNSGDTNTGIFFPAADTTAFTEGGFERMRIDSSGNVGIGSTSITAIGTGVPTLELKGTSGSFTGRSGGIALITQDGTTNKSYIYADTDLYIQSTTATNTRFYTNNAERMRITSAGRVGIGTTSPSRALHVATGVLTLANNNGALFTDTSNAGVLLGSDNAIGYISGVTAAGTGTAKLLLQPFGEEVLVAATTDNGAYNLQCNGTGVWGAGAYVNGSDERIKEDIAPIQSGLDVVQKLNPVTYKYKETWSKDQSTQTGFIAQELLTALEGEVYIDGVVQQGGQEEYYSVAYQNIIPILTKAIQEQQQIINDLKARIETLENK